MKTWTITLVDGTQTESGEISILHGGEVCRVTLDFRGRRYEGASWSFFDAFCDIRKELEPLGVLVSCYGGSLNAHPGGMAGRSSDGLAAYRMHDDRPATTDDLVHIFDTGDDVVPATVADQRARFESWIFGGKAGKKWWQIWK